MLLHEAVQAARKDLRMSQKRLAELAGIQRRQLATLESGGNITLATLRKVLAHLPNLETFTIDAVTATVRRNVSPPEQEEVVAEAIQVMQTALLGLAEALNAGRKPGEREMRVFEQANEVMYSGLGYTADDIRREYERIRKHHLTHPELATGPAADLVAAVETAAEDVDLAEAEAELAALEGTGEEGDAAAEESGAEDEES
jgi:transcriptional regulator with XRE-family HTH domain